jgi:hypothetical protein
MIVPKNVNVFENFWKHHTKIEIAHRFNVNFPDFDYDNFIPRERKCIEVL